MSHQTIHLSPIEDANYAPASPTDSYASTEALFIPAPGTPYQTPKLAPKRHGPFPISKQVSPVVYQLQLPDAWKIHDVFHASLLTPYHETSQHGPNYIKPPPELIEGEHEYEVETIVNHRLHGKTKALQYLLK